jgi:hypothetical protein
MRLEITELAKMNLADLDEKTQSPARLLIYQ